MEGNCDFRMYFPNSMSDAHGIKKTPARTIDENRPGKQAG